MIQDVQLFKQKMYFKFLCGREKSGLFGGAGGKS